MDYNKEYLVKILGAFVQEKEAPVPEKEINWETIFALGQIHSVTGIIYYMVKNLGQDHKPPEVIMRTMKEIYMRNIYKDVQVSYELDILNQEFAKEKIPHVFVKGYILKHYYPVPELRTMGDVDFLIKKEDREKTKDTLVN